MLGGIDNGLFLKSFAGFIVIIFFILILRWAFSNGKSLIAKPGRAGAANEYGLLIPIASPSNFIEGEMLRQKLLAVGIRANLTQTVEGIKIMVFERDARTARAVFDS